MGKYFEELDYQQTPLGELTLCRRRIPALGEKDIFEIKLNGEYLMSSLFYGSEVALSTLGLAACNFPSLDVVVGGLGLGFTASTALDEPRLRSLIVVEYLEPVIAWHRSEILPLGPKLNADSRCQFFQGDFFIVASGDCGGFSPSEPGKLFHAILLDIDHSPEHHLNPSHAAFYSEAGLSKLAQQLHPGGVFALWSNDPPENKFLTKLKGVFATCQAHVVSFPNPIRQEESQCTVYVSVKN